MQPASLPNQLRAILPQLQWPLCLWQELGKQFLICGRDPHRGHTSNILYISYLHYDS